MVATCSLPLQGVARIGGKIFLTAANLVKVGLAVPHYELQPNWLEEVPSTTFDDFYRFVVDRSEELLSGPCSELDDKFVVKEKRARVIWEKISSPRLPIIEAYERQFAFINASYESGHSEEEVERTYARNEQLTSMLKAKLRRAQSFNGEKGVSSGSP